MIKNKNFIAEMMNDLKYISDNYAIFKPRDKLVDGTSMTSYDLYLRFMSDLTFICIRNKHMKRELKEVADPLIARMMVDLNKDRKRVGNLIMHYEELDFITKLDICSMITDQ